MKMSPVDLTKVPEKITMAKSSETKDRWLPLWMHAADTTAVTEYLLESWMPKPTKQALCELTDGTMTFERLYRTGRLLALLHDLGKATSEFQSVITQGYPEIQSRLEDSGLELRYRDSQKSAHALIGQRLLLEYKGCKGDAPYAVACIIGAHHGKPEEDAKAGRLPARTGRWGAFQDAWIKFALEQSGYDAEPLPKIRMSSQMLWVGLLIMADWIASNASYFPLIAADENGGDVDYESRKRRAVEKLNLTPPWVPGGDLLCADLYMKRFGFLPNDVQKMTAEAVRSATQPGIFILEAQMGVGKTEAALAAAEDIAGRTLHSGIYFGLPTQATSDGIFGRLKGWADKQAVNERHTIRLVHGAAALNEDYQKLRKFRGSASVQDEDLGGGVFVNEWFSGRKQSLLADFAVGTVDQFLMAGLKQKHVMLRHLGLANKIVIVDECHAYDAYMNRYFDAALRWLGAYRVPVILLSATLPAARRRELISAYQNKRDGGAYDDGSGRDDYPRLTWTDGGEIHSKALTQTERGRRTALEFADFENDDFEALAKKLKGKTASGGCVGVILNTVKRAQACAEALKSRFSADEVMLIHSQYLMADRAVREKALTDALGKNASAGAGRPDRLIVVGTQVLEQSLDIDFDYLVSDLCPMDLLLQRIGRLHRHIWRKRPLSLRDAECLILCALPEEPEKGAAAVYGEYLLMRTRAILKGRSEIYLPDDIAPLVQQTYDESRDVEDGAAASYSEAYFKAYIEAKKKHSLNISEKEKQAENFCLGKPNASRRRPYIYNLLNMSLKDGLSDSAGTAAVRDGDPSVEVLCVRRGGDGRLYTMDDAEFKRPLSADTMPCEEDGRRIAGQRLRLPHILCVGRRLDAVIRYLEEETSRNLKEWLYSPWLHGELFVIFDEESNADIAQFRLHYSSEKGLEVWKKED